MVSDSLSHNYAIVLLSYNHPDLTERCIGSVLELNFPKNHFFLIHNGSETKNINRLQNRFPDISHVIIPENIGFAAGTNFGLKKAFTDFAYVFFLTNDTEVLKIPSFIPPQFQFISPEILKRNTTKIDSVAGIVNSRLGTLKHLKINTLPNYEFVLNKDNTNNLDSKYFELNTIYKLKKHESFYIPGTSFVIHKNIFNLLNGFDESFHTYWEDVDFSFRFKNVDFKMYTTQLFSLKHKIGKTCHKDRFYTLYLYQRNRKKFMKKHNQFNIFFIINYSKDLFNIFFKIIFKKNRAQNLKYLWKVIYE